MMSIIRVKKDARYFSASNEPFNDKRLSWEARGLMGYLLSKPDGWQVRMTDLEEQGPAGNHKLRRMLAELRKYGYMNRIRVTLDGGKFDWITDVYESPTQNPNPSKAVIKSSGGKSTSGSSTSGELPDLKSTEKTTAYGEVIKAYESNIGPITPMIATKIGYEFDTFYDEPEGPSWLLWAIGVAVENNALSFRYIKKCLENRKKHGKGWKPNGKPPETPAPTMPDFGDLERVYGI